MTDTSTPTVEIRTDNTEYRRTWDENGERPTFQRRDVKFKVTGADPIMGANGSNITPDVLYIRWKDGVLDHVMIEGLRHKANGQPGVQRNTQTFRPREGHGLPLDQLPEWAATALATVQPGDTDKLLAGMRERIILALALDDRADTLMDEANESGEENEEEDVRAEALGEALDACRFASDLDEGLANGALLPIAWRSAEHQMSPAEIKAAATGPVGWPPPVPAFTEPQPDLRGAQGVQIGDRCEQTNVF